MTNYELTLILPREIAKELLNDLVQQITLFIQEEGGILGTQQIQEKTPLPDPIKQEGKKYKEGNIAILSFLLNQEKTAKLDNNLKLDKRILRFLLCAVKSHKSKIPSLAKTAPAESLPEEQVRVTFEDIDKKLEEILKEQV